MLKKLKDLEAQAIHPASSYVEVGEALLAIRDYRFAEMEDDVNVSPLSSSAVRFKAATGCDKLRGPDGYWAKLGLSERRVRELVAAAKCYRNLESGKPSPLFLPKTERIIRFISWITNGKYKPDVEGQRYVWAKAVELCGEFPTSPQIQLIIKEYHKKKIVGIRQGMALAHGDLTTEEKRRAQEIEFNMKFREVWVRLLSKYRYGLDFEFMYDSAQQTLEESRIENDRERSTVRDAR